MVHLETTLYFYKTLDQMEMNFIFQDAGGNSGNPRLSGITNINLLEGKNFLDLTSSTTSLAGQSLQITTGTNDDILWLSDANENVNSGNGNDQITVNGGD